MNLILTAEAPAGLTIDNAIMDAIALSQQTGCMIKIDLNDIPMLISYGKIFGKNIPEMTKHFVQEYTRRRIEKEKEN